MSDSEGSLFSHRTQRLDSQHIVASVIQVFSSVPIKVTMEGARFGGFKATA